VAGYLVDSHIFLWASESPVKLLKAERDVLTDRRFDVAVSVASIWELSIKAVTGRLAIPGRKQPIPAGHFSRSAASMGFAVLPIEAAEAEYASQLPRIHGDPFDRLLIAQGLLGDRILVTRDAVFSRYPGAQVFRP